MRRSALGWAAALLVLAFVIVLGVPREQRALALYAFLLLAGALVLAGLVALLAAMPAAADERLRAAPAAGEQPPGDLEALERDVRDALREGSVSDRLWFQLRAVASMALACRHGVDLARDPETAERLLGDGPALALLGAPRSRTPVRLRARELAAAIDELERL
jgi:hypothetical protein